MAKKYRQIFLSARKFDEEVFAKHAEMSLLNVAKVNQFMIVITLFRLLLHRVEFRLVQHQLENCVITIQIQINCNGIGNRDVLWFDEQVVAKPQR